MTKGFIIGSVALLIGLVITLSSCTVLKPSAYPHGEKKIILTIDDGPSPETTRQLLAVFQKHKIPASFCFIGENMEEHPTLVKATLDQGHRIVLHSHHHTERDLFDRDRMEESLTKYKDTMAQAGYPLSNERILFRPPFGWVTPQVYAFARHHDLQYAYVTSYVHDSPMNHEDQHSLFRKLQRKVQRAQGGAIVLHESHHRAKHSHQPIDKSWLPAALDQFISWAHSEGYEFVHYPSGTSQ